MTPSSPEADPNARPAPLPLRRRAEEMAYAEEAPCRMPPAREAIAQVLLACGAFLAGALAALTLGAWMFAVVLAAIVGATCAGWWGWRWMGDHRRGVEDAGARLHAVQRELDRMQSNSAGGCR